MLTRGRIISTFTIYTFRIRCLLRIAVFGDFMLRNFPFLDHSKVTASVGALPSFNTWWKNSFNMSFWWNTIAFQKAGLKKTKAEQQKKFPLKLDAIHNFYDFLKRAAELDGSQLALELYEKHKVTVKPYFNCFDPDQLAMVFTWLGFEIEIM